MKKNINLLFPIFSILLLFWIEQGQNVPYLVKTMSKILLFLTIPYFLFGKTSFSFLQIRKTDKKSLIVAFISGFLMLTIIIITFITVRSYIDIDSLILDLHKAGVTKAVFPFVALYILFGNSLLEEFFFRGLLPSFIQHERLRLFVPSFLFALYHVTIFLPWFSPQILILAVLGLWIGGIIFQLANERSRTIFPSWIIHMFADVGVLLIGVYMFYFY